MLPIRLGEEIEVEIHITVPLEVEIEIKIPRWRRSRIPNGVEIDNNRRSERRRG